MEEKMVSIEYVIPESLQNTIAEKIASEVKSLYLNNVARSVSEFVFEELKKDGFTERVAKTVVEKIKISEKEYTEGVTEQVKDALMKTTGIIANEVLKKVQEKVQSYGFIEIGKR